MFTGLLIIAIAGFLGVLSHRRSRLENKIYKNVPLDDWLMAFALPISLYIGWFFVVKNIISRPLIEIFPLSDFDIFALTILFMVYGFVGNGIHFTGKILWRHMKNHQHTMAYKINEIFHGKLSHYLIYLNGIFIFFLMAVLELNHPLGWDISDFLGIIAILGIIFGYSASRAIFYTNEWFGGYNKPLFSISTIIIGVLIGLDIYYHLDYSSYPVYLFVTSMIISFASSFVLRQFFIFIKLGNKRRLRFVAKMFSV